jgi:hypothetical protein
MSQHLRVARLYLLLLGIFTVARWLQGVFGAPYEKAHHIFSIVILTALSALYYGAFTRRWRGYHLSQAMVLGALLGLISQVVIFAATLLSYALGLHTFFNHPTALNLDHPIPFGPEVLVIRFRGLIANSILSGIIGGLGWALGGVLPKDGQSG